MSWCESVTVHHVQRFAGNKYTEGCLRWNTRTVNLSDSKSYIRFEGLVPPMLQKKERAPHHAGVFTGKENEGIINPNAGQSQKTAAEQPLSVNLQGLKWK